MYLIIISYLIITLFESYSLESPKLLFEEQILYFRVFTLFLIFNVGNSEKKIVKKHFQCSLHKKCKNIKKVKWR